MLICYFFRGYVKVMSFQDVAFLPYRATFSTTLLKNSGTGEGLGTTICLKAVVGGMGVCKGGLPVKLFFSNKTSILCQSKLMEIERHIEWR